MLTPPTNNTISVLQANIGAWKTNQAEIDDILIRTKPDLVLLHETNLRPTQPVKVRGYACIRCDRLTPRGNTDTVKGGGVMILVKSEGDRPLPYSQLPPLPKAPTDNTTEAVGVRLHILGSSLDVHCRYVPPIRPGAGDTRQ